MMSFQVILYLLKRICVVDRMILRVSLYTFYINLSLKKDIYVFSGPFLKNEQKVILICLILSETLAQNCSKNFAKFTKYQFDFIWINMHIVGRPWKLFMEHFGTASSTFRVFIACNMSRDDAAAYFARQKGWERAHTLPVLHQVFLKQLVQASTTFWLLPCSTFSYSNQFLG